MTKDEVADCMNWYDAYWWGLWPASKAALTSVAEDAWRFLDAHSVRAALNVLAARGDQWAPPVEIVAHVALELRDFVLSGGPLHHEHCILSPRAAEELAALVDKEDLYG